MNPIRIKLEPNLSDLFQHCELKCNAECCEWDAFDFSERWLNRWCEFREPYIVVMVRTEISDLLGKLNGIESGSVAIEGFFAPSIESLLAKLQVIKEVVGPN